MQKHYYAAIHNSQDIWKKSSSGGAFTALTDVWFSAYGKKAAVYGCVLDENLKAKHARAVTGEQRDAMRGSKYIASDTTGIYALVEEDLKTGIYVLFSGTPCQIAALKSYLAIKKLTTGEQLLTVEVICHGVGSNRFFEEYISDLESRYKSKAVTCSFRGKSRPEKIQEMYIVFQNKRKYISPAARFDWFLTAYQRNYILRPACFDCDVTAGHSQADISIGDHWADHSIQARTLMVAETELGKSWIESLRKTMTLENLCESDVHEHIPAKKPKNYGEFWKVYERDGYLAAQTWLGNNTFLTRCKTTIADILYRLHITSLLKWMLQIVKG